jgi:hypothetical protein
VVSVAALFDGRQPRSSSSPQITPSGPVRYSVSAENIVQIRNGGRWLIAYPPMQAGASFNVGDLKAKVEQVIAASKANSD